MKKLQGLVRLVIVSSSFFSLLCQARSEPDSVSVPFPDGKAPDGTRYKKSYKCEGEQISIGCKIHERIQVIRANYGRFSLAICNKHGSTDLSVNCMSPQSTGILKTKCDNLSNCTMQVNSHVFGEPCAGVQKYLEVHYACVTNSGIHSGTTPRLPPWLLEGGTGNLWQDNEDTYFERDDEVDDEDEEEDEEYEDSLRRKPILVQATTPVRIPITTPKPTTTTSSSTTVPESSSGDPSVRVNELAHVNQLEIVSNPDSGDSGSTDVAPSWGCPPSHSRFLDWNRTSEGEVSIQPCPSGTTGLARWMCGRDGSRTSLQPDMSDCKSQTMSELEASVRNEEPESVIASRLSILTGKRFFGGDLESSISVIKSVSNRLQYLIANREDFYNKESFVSDVFQNIFRSASNLFNNGVVWKDLIETSRRSKVASDLVAVLNECAFLWADTLDEPEIVYESTNNAIMAISSTFAKSQSFPSSSNVPEWFAEEETLTVRLPEISRLRKIVFFTYKNLNSLLPPKKLDANIVSHVVSAQLRRPVRKDEESETSVSVLFRTEDNMEELSCGRWDFEIGDWTRSGCEFVRKEDFAVECSCDSLGAFALLSSKRAVGKNLGEGDSFRENTSGFFSNVITLEIATYIISIVCFLILVLIVIQFRKQIQKLLRSSGCGGCCHCLDREDPDKSRDLYTGATLMETAAGVTSTTTTTASSSSATSSTSTTLPSRMVTTLSPDNRVGIIQHHYNDPTALSQSHPHHYQYREVLYGNDHRRGVPENVPRAYGGTPLANNFHNSSSINSSGLNNHLPQLHQVHTNQPPPQKLNNALYPHRREEREYKMPIVSDDREYAYHSESSSSGVSGSSSSSRLQRQSPGNNDINNAPSHAQIRGGVFPPYGPPLYHGQSRSISSPEAGCRP